MLAVSASRRPMFRTSAAGKAMELDLSDEEANPADAGSRKHAKGELVADLDRAWQRLNPLQRWTRRPGNRNFATATRQAAALRANPASRAGKANFY